MAPQAGTEHVRVLLCDDALGFPALVASWLNGSSEAEHVGTTASATELLEVIGSCVPDVVLLDLMLPEGKTTPELVQRVRDLAPGIRVILISSLPAAMLADEVGRVGADGSCPKATTPERLLDVVTGGA
jgi:DNA-binding NarL/FixJ family response regulator